MSRIFLSGLIILCLLSAPLRAAEFVGNVAAAELPISVRILDFNTTKKLCGSINPPDWCPAHLLRDEIAGADTGAGEDDFFSGSSVNTFKQTNYSAVFE